MTERRIITTDRGDIGKRLDLVLQRHLRDVTSASRTRIQRWIEDGLVTVNEITVARAARRTAHGDIVCVSVPATARRLTMLPEALPLDVVHEDAHLLVVNKPAGMVVHPTFRHPHATLMNALMWYARDWPGETRPSLVGRLDRLTSGAVLVAKSPAAHRALQRALATSRAEKRYLALVYGHVNASQGAIDVPLSRSRTQRKTIVDVHGGGAKSRTTFERWRTVSATPVGLALLCCRLITGRTHQIRAHLASRGWPIVGDTKYGRPLWTKMADPVLTAALRAFPRQALHAWRLAFVHPATGTPFTCEAPLPADFRDLLAHTGLL